jgi:hypothetical protein
VLIPSVCGLFNTLGSFFDYGFPEMLNQLSLKHVKNENIGRWHLLSNLIQKVLSHERKELVEIGRGFFCLHHHYILCFRVGM